MFQCSTSYFHVLLKQIFLCNSNCTYTLVNTSLCIHIFITHIYHVWICDYLVIISDDIEANIEPNFNSLEIFFSLSLEFEQYFHVQFFKTIIIIKHRINYHDDLLNIFKWAILFMG